MDLAALFNAKGKEIDALKSYMNIAINYKHHTDRFNNMLKVEYVESDLQAGTATFKYPVENWMLNPKDLLHGGVEASMVDLSMGLFANCIGNKLGAKFCPTVSLTTHYIRPVRMGVNVVVKATLLSSSRSLITLRADLFEEGKDEISVTGTATYKVQK